MNENKVEVEELNTSEKGVKDIFPSTTNLVGHLEIAKHFEIDIPSNEESDKLRYIWKFVKGIDPIMNPETVILGIERKLGSPKLGESMLDKVYRYIKLREEQFIVQEKISRELESSDNLPRQ